MMTTGTAPGPTAAGRGASTLPEGLVPYHWTIEEYEALVKADILSDDRIELIEGLLVEKMVKKPDHSAGSEGTWRAIHAALPPGWHVRIEKPVRIPNRDSEPEPDVSVVRGSHRDYRERDPDPADVALVVEVVRSSLAADRALALTYGGGRIPAYWIVNVLDRQIEIYFNPVDGAYPPPVIIPESGSVDLVIDGQVVAQIPAAELLGTD
jgi:Uma2 family endonuclease